MFAIALQVTVLRPKVKRVGDHQNFIFEHKRFQLHTRVVWNMSGTSLSKEKRGFRGHACTLLLPVLNTNWFTPQFYHQILQEWMTGGTRTASSSRCVHSVKPMTKRSKKLAPPHPDLACSIDLKRLRNKESPYDRKRATVPEKPKLLSCMLAIAKRQRQELRMNTTISILVVNSAKVKYKAGREFAVGLPQAC